MGKHHEHHAAVIPIAKPLAGHHLTKKIGGVIAKSCEGKKLIYGVKDTQKALKNHQTGLCILGGNVTPMDVITHIPSICEEAKMPYVFLPTKEHISAYAQRTTPVACVIVPTPTEAEQAAEFNQVIEEINQISAQSDAPEKAE